MENIGLREILIGIGAFALTFVGSLLVIGILLVRIPADYFRTDYEPRRSTAHPVLRWSARIIKNCFGYAVIALGIVMSLPLVPGQGILTIMIGLMLIDFPGKRRLERSLVSRPRVLRTINRIRQRYGRSPLQLD